MSIIDSALTQIRQLHPYTPGKPVEELERELGIANAIKLASNENPLGYPRIVTEILSKVSEHVELYPDANAYYLKQRLARHLGVGEDQITIGNGSNDVLDLIARVTVEPGTEAIIAEHSFVVYRLAVTCAGGTLVTVPAKNYGADLDGMLAAITERTKLLFVCNPNNPTGTSIGSEALDRFLQGVPDGVVVAIRLQRCRPRWTGVSQQTWAEHARWLRRRPTMTA